jgi:hypothetical protein
MCVSGGVSGACVVQGVCPLAVLPLVPWQPLRAAHNDDARLHSRLSAVLIELGLTTCCFSSPCIGHGWLVLTAELVLRHAVLP